MEDPDSISEDAFIDHVFGMGYCFGTLRAVLATNTLYEAILEGHALFCMMTETVKYVDLVKHTLAWMRENPGNMTWNAEQIMIMALKAKYPCYKDVTKAWEERCMPQYNL
jgi:hypothetical protein